MRLVILLALALGCGGRTGGHLSGPVGLRFVWSGTWSTADRNYVEAFVVQIAETDYFAPLRAQGVAPHFFIDPQSKYVLRISAPDGASLSGCAWHSASGEVVIAPLCGTFFNGLITRALSHELVEFANDPAGDDPSHEIADACSPGSSTANVAGRDVAVARYVLNGLCFPTP